MYSPRSHTESSVSYLGEDAMYTIEQDDFRVPVNTWIPPGEIEDGACVQIANAARHLDAAAHIAVMSDVHPGYGVTIGTVFPTLNAVIPNAVGVDIGCGMCAIATGVKWDRERMGREFWRHWSARSPAMCLRDSMSTAVASPLVSSIARCGQDHSND